MYLKIQGFVGLPLCLQLCLPVGLGLATHAGADGATDLGGAPVCEASALAIQRCPEDPRADCLIVADNEVRDRLFVYTLSERGPDPGSRRETRIEPEISDIEALALSPQGELLIYGSHSRNKNCKRRANRRVVAGVRLAADASTISSFPAIRTPIDATAKALFGASAVGTLARVATAFRAGESGASKDECAQTLDIEGAVRVGDHVWLGLRAPLVDGHAVLVRHDPRAGTLRFDEARLVDLGGHGIRGLASSGDAIYGLSAGRLWRFPARALEQSSRGLAISVETLTEVPAHSEGIAIYRDLAIVVQDGKQGSPGCKITSTFITTPVPPTGGPS